MVTRSRADAVAGPSTRAPAGSAGAGFTGASRTRSDAIAPVPEPAATVSAAARATAPPPAASARAAAEAERCPLRPPRPGVLESAITAPFAAVLDERTKKGKSQVSVVTDAAQRSEARRCHTRTAKCGVAGANRTGRCSASSQEPLRREADG
jgi:hypothetical protein